MYICIYVFIYIYINPIYVKIYTDEGLEQALIEGREVLFTSNIADSYVFSSPDMALTILIKDNIEKKVGSNKVFIYVMMMIMFTL
jgi:hypothetical protein